MSRRVSRDAAGSSRSSLGLRAPAGSRWSAPQPRACAASRPCPPRIGWHVCRHLALVVLAFLSIAAQPATPTASEPAGIGLRLLGVEEPAIVDHVERGETVVREVEVSNSTDETVRVELYPTAARVVGGGFVISPGRGGNDLAKWTTITPEVVQLDPGERATAEVAIAVPEDVYGGERYGAIVAELPEQQGGGQVSVVSRLAIRVYLSVGGPKAPIVDLVVGPVGTARSAEGLPVVTAVVRNTGERALDVTGQASLREGPSGLSAGPVRSDGGVVIAPGESGTLAFPFGEGIPEGPWTATVTASGGDIARRAEAVISFPPLPGAPSPTMEPAATSGVDRGLARTAAALLIVATGAIIVVQRRRYLTAN